MTAFRILGLSTLGAFLLGISTCSAGCSRISSSEHDGGWGLAIFGAFAMAIGVILLFFWLVGWVSSWDTTPGPGLSSRGRFGRRGRGRGRGR